MIHNEPAWHWTRYTHPTRILIQDVQVQAAPSDGYLALSIDGIDWTFFSGPLRPDDQALTRIGDGHLGSPVEQQARAVAGVLPSDGVWRLPRAMEATHIHLGHTASVLILWPHQFVTTSEA